MSGAASFPRVPVSWGELIDKISILGIKTQRLRSPEAAANARRELQLLSAIAAEHPAPPTALGPLKQALDVANRRLWDIEDAIRAKEAAQSFDAGFIELARAVYRTNDERARLKRQINDLLHSGIIEEKQYG